jgi:hypothetical protein
MATLTRTNSRATNYKDYVNFLGGYKNGKKDEQGENPGEKFHAVEFQQYQFFGVVQLGRSGFFEKCMYVV